MCHVFRTDRFIKQSTATNENVVPYPAEGVRNDSLLRHPMPRKTTFVSIAANQNTLSCDSCLVHMLTDLLAGEQEQDIIHTNSLDLASTARSSSSCTSTASLSCLSRSGQSLKLASSSAM